MACFGRWSCLLLALAALEETQAFSATWSQVTPSGSEPGARWGHKAVLTTSGACFFAGSDSSSNYFEDSWCFDLSARSWDEKFTNYGPLSRRKHSTAAYQERMWIFGGEDSSGQMSSELWELDPQDSSWTQLHISAATPPGRRGHSAVMTAGMLYVFGGYSSGGNLNDLWSIDTQAGAPTWQEISSISAPSAREDHSAVLMNTAMWIFGGSAGGGAMNDVWFVDLSQAPGFWTEISTSGTTVRRTGHSAHVHSDKMWVFGGHDGGGFSGALAYLDLTDQGGSYSWWEDTSSSGTRPAGRLRHAAVLDQSRLWVFGGSSSSGDLKDVWYVDLEAATTTTSVSTTISSTTSSSLSATISSTTTNTGTSSSSTATTSSTSSSSSSSSTSSTSSSTSSASSSSTSSGSSSMTTSASSTASMTSSLTASSSSSITSHSSTTTGSTSITMTLTSSTTVSRTVSSISSSTSSTSSTTWTDSTTSSASSTLSTSSSATSTVSTTNSVTSTVSTSFTSSTSTSSSPASTSATTSTSRTTTNTRTTATSSFTTSVTTSSTTSTGTTTTATGTTITVTGAGLELKRQEEAFEASASVERAEEVAVQELLAVLGNQTHSSETGILVELEPVETEAGLVKTAALAPEGLAVDNVTVSAPGGPATRLRSSLIRARELKESQRLPLSRIYKLRSELKVEGLSETHAIELQLSVREENASAMCAFWDEEAQRWSVEGVQTVPGSSPGQLTCRTTHLSIFAAVAGFVADTVFTKISCATPWDYLAETGLANLSRSDRLLSLPAIVTYMVIALFMLVLARAIYVDRRAARALPWEERWLVLLQTTEETQEPEAEARKGCAGRADGLLRGAADSSIRMIHSHRSGVTVDSLDILLKPGEKFEQQVAEASSVQALSAIPGRLSQFVHSVAQKSEAVVGQFMTQFGVRAHGSSAVHFVLKQPWCARVGLLFLAGHPWLDLTRVNLRISFRVRVALLFLEVATTAMLAAVWFTSDATVEDKEECRRADWIANFFERLIQQAVVAFFALILGNLVILGLFLLQRPAVVKRQEWTEELSKRQQRSWIWRNRLFWFLWSLQMIVCLFYIVVFLANVSPEDATTWQQTVALTLVQSLILWPLIMALALASVVSLSLRSRRTRESIEKRWLEDAAKAAEADEGRAEASGVQGLNLIRGTMRTIGSPLELASATAIPQKTTQDQRLNPRPARPPDASVSSPWKSRTSKQSCRVCLTDSPSPGLMSSLGLPGGTSGPEPYALSGHRLATPKGAEMGEDGETKISVTELRAELRAHRESPLTHLQAARMGKACG
eukprot:s848_g4.t5